MPFDLTPLVELEKQLGPEKFEEAIGKMCKASAAEIDREILGGHMDGKRTFEVWRDGAWVDCTMQEIRKGERFRIWDDAAKTESAHRKPEGEVALGDPHQRPDDIWTIEVAQPEVPKSGSV